MEKIESDYKRNIRGGEWEAVGPLKSYLIASILHNFGRWLIKETIVYI